MGVINGRVKECDHNCLSVDITMNWQQKLLAGYHRGWGVCVRMHVCVCVCGAGVIIGHGNEAVFM